MRVSSGFIQISINPYNPGVVTEGGHLFLGLIISQHTISNQCFAAEERHTLGFDLPHLPRHCLVFRVAEQNVRKLMEEDSSLKVEA